MDFAHSSRFVFYLNINHNIHYQYFLDVVACEAVLCMRAMGNLQT